MKFIDRLALLIIMLCFTFISMVFSHLENLFITILWGVLAIIVLLVFACSTISDCLTGVEE